MNKINMKDLFGKYKYYSVSVIVVLTIAITSGLAWFVNNLPDPIIKSIFESVASNNIHRNAFEEDGIYIITTGTGAPIPDINRTGPQTVIVAGEQILVFDSGPGTTRNLEISPVNISEIDAFFFTHYHSDHIGDFGELMIKHWASGANETPLVSYGPPGLRQVVEGFMSAYELDREYRIEHHGDAVAPPSGFGADVREFDFGNNLDDSEVVYEEGGVIVTAFNVSHPPVVPAVGYRIEYQGKTIAFTGDTIYTDSLVNHIRGADLLISEMLNHKFSQWLSDATSGSDSTTSSVARDIQDSHIDAPQVGIMATEANIPQVLITHVLPPVTSDLIVNPFLRGMKAEYDGIVDLANDGTMLFVPLDSNNIQLTELFK